MITLITTRRLHAMIADEAQLHQELNAKANLMQEQAEAYDALFKRHEEQHMLEMRAVRAAEVEARNEAAVLRGKIVQLETQLREQAR